MLVAWVGKKSQVWSLCCSTFQGCDTAAKFHTNCDNKSTLTVAHNAGNAGSNPGNFTFGGFVRTFFSLTRYSEASSDNNRE